ncbi:hypothetical protein IYY11_01735 [Methylocystis sp. H62]|jgi:hypothetical protein|uniref:hypothetical protein n=1 Tax=Methylocystis sp. H62 TaxID=2785789 RepID=UPI0018C311D5|nr:hypothetical protein [Methylocystis sp. H62]MBG0792199.1 hypothetical protein [Methylocystis sp. H62]
MSSDTVMLHVRFGPDGGVVEISERPAPNSAQAWFDWVSLNVPDGYQALSGGRGVFRMTRDKLEELRASIAANNAAA